MRAGTQVNVMQASKFLMRKLTLRNMGESRWQTGK